MSNYTLKAKNKKTGEIVEFEIVQKGLHVDYVDITNGKFYVPNLFNELYEVVEDKKKLQVGDMYNGQEITNIMSTRNDIDPNHPYGGMEVLDNVPVETWEDRFNMEFVDEDTGLLNISKYDHERIINFFNNEIK
jgi:hypothetical protein